MILPRSVFGLVGAAIVVVLSILNTVLGTAIPVIPAAIQFLLDFLFAGTRKLMGASASSPGAADDPVIAYTQSTDPEQWSVSVRGDVFRFGSFSPSRCRSRISWSRGCPSMVGRSAWARRRSRSQRQTQPLDQPGWWSSPWVPPFLSRRSTLRWS